MKAEKNEETKKEVEDKKETDETKTVEKTEPEPSPGSDSKQPSYQANWLKGASQPFKPSKNLLAAVNASTRYMNPRHQGFKSNGHLFVDPQFAYQQQIYHVKLAFAGEEFTGEGATLQLAKHNAASRALEYFSNTDNFLKAKSLAESTHNKTVKAYRPPHLAAAGNNDNYVLKKSLFKSI